MSLKGKANRLLRSIKQRIDASFGSVDACMKELAAGAVSQFGSGSPTTCLSRLRLPTFFEGPFRIAGSALMKYLQNRAIHAEDNGGNLSHDDQWREGRSTTGTLPNVS